MRLNPFRRKALTGTPEVVEALAARQLQPFFSLGGSNINTQRIGSVFVQHQSASYAYMYIHQPAVRTVVDYVARNIAQLGLKTYERVSDDERQHAGDHPAAVALRNPNEATPGQQFIFNLVADFMVYDNAYVIKLRGEGSDKLALLNIPPSAVGILGQRRFIAEGYRFYRADGTHFDLPASDVLHWRGYNPEEPRMGVSKLETLREELAADAAARQAKTELDQAGFAPRGWIERPAEAPDWSLEAMDRFRETWGNSGPRKTRVLEDGMQFKQSALSPEQTQALESRQFTLSQAAGIFGLGNIPPENKEERDQAIEDVLQPLCEMLCSYLDLSILVGEFDADDYYTEFDLDEKRMGNDRLKAITSAIGAPPLTRNEGRAMLNEPPVPGGDLPITPLNVFAGDPSKAPKPSTDVMPIQDPNKPSQEGDHRTEPKALAKAVPDRSRVGLPLYGTDLILKDGTGIGRGWSGSLYDVKDEQVEHLMPRFRSDMARQHRYNDETRGLLSRMYARQAKVLQHKSGGKMDLDRWDREFADDIYTQTRSIVEREGGIYVARLAGQDFDLREVEHYLQAAALNVAVAFNRQTEEDIDAMGLAAAMARALNERVETGAASLATRSTVFARTEAAVQAPHPERRMKQWIADTERHASLNGAMVPLDETWGGIQPGSLPNCKCSVSIV